MYKIILFVFIYHSFLFAGITNNKIEKEYFKSGELKYIIPYKNGKREGITKLYYITGELKKLTPYKNNLIDGVVKTYYKNGNLESKFHYKEGKKDSINTSYYQSGALFSIITLENNNQDGMMKTYYENGNIQSIITYKNGQIVKSTNFNNKIKQNHFFHNQYNEQDILIKSYDDLIKATTNLTKPIDQRWVFLDKNNNLQAHDDPIFIEYFHKYFYYMLDKKIELQNKTNPSKSMQNTIYKNEPLLVFKGLNTIFRGGVFAYYYNKEVIYLKRCIATTGDIIFLQNKSLYLHPKEGNKYVQNNYKSHIIKKVDQRLFIKDPYMTNHTGIHHDIKVTKKNTSFPKLFDMDKITVAKDECFMMGDNRDHSNDSRFTGTVKYESIIGVTIPIKLKANSK